MKILQMTEASPKLQELQDTHARLGRERAEVFARIVEIGSIFREGKDSADRAREGKARQERLDAIVAGRPAPPNTDPLEVECRKAQERLRDIDQAMEIVDRLAEAERCVAEAKVRASVGTLFSTRHKALLEALKGFHQASLELHEVADVLAAQGVSAGEYVYGWPSFAGDPRDKNSPMALFYRSQVERGLIRWADVPSELR